MKLGLWPPIFHFLSLSGIYVIKIFKNNSWKYVMVDEYIPSNVTGDILFAKSNDLNEIWV